MRGVITMFLVLIMGLACGDKKKELDIPEGILSKEHFSEVMVDMLVIEGYKSRITRSNKEKQAALRSYYRSAFDKHNTTKEEYMKSYEFYSNHSDVLEKLIRNAERKFKEIEDRVVSERNKKGLKKETDSIPQKKILIPGSE